MKKELTKPVLKWAGGKRQLVEELVSGLPKAEYKRYFEPFVGGGALLFELQPKNAVINDANVELINVYTLIRDNADELIKLLAKYQKAHSKEFFYKMREMDRDESYGKLTDVEKAARTIYLNRTCYNGLYRVNKKGEFNTPIGKYKNPQILNEENIRAIEKYLKKNKVVLLNGDFAHALSKARKNDFVYLDPPYHPLTKTSSFTDYTKVGFGEAEQIKLKIECDKLNKKGCFFMQSNSDCEFIRELYKEYNIKPVSVRRSINSKKDGRTDITEVLITNY